MSPLHLFSLIFNQFAVHGVNSEYIAIEFVKVDVGQYRGDDSPLGRATMRLMKPPVFHITGFQHLPDDIQKLGVINLLLQQLHENSMVDVVEEAFNVEFDEPLCT